MKNSSFDGNRQSAWPANDAPFNAGKKVVKTFPLAESRRAMVAASETGAR